MPKVDPSRIVPVEYPIVPFKEADPDHPEAVIEMQLQRLGVAEFLGLAIDTQKYIREWMTGPTSHGGKPFFPAGLNGRRPAVNEVLIDVCVQLAAMQQQPEEDRYSVEELVRMADSMPKVFNMLQEQARIVRDVDEGFKKGGLSELSVPSTPLPSGAASTNSETIQPSSTDETPSESLPVIRLAAS